MSSDWNVLSQLYREALARGSSERAAFLDEAFAGDVGLRKELDSLLAYVASPDVSLDLSIANQPSHAVADSPSTIEGQHDRLLHSSLGRQFDDAVAARVANHSWLATLGSTARRTLLEAMEVREYDVGEYLIRQGDPADYLLLIVSGTASARLHEAPADRPPLGQFCLATSSAK